MTTAIVFLMLMKRASACICGKMECLCSELTAEINKGGGRTLDFNCRGAYFFLTYMTLPQAEGWLYGYSKSVVI